MDAKNQNGNHQQRFFARLARRFPKKGDLVNAVGQVLHLGRDAIYRRLRGDTVLSADELYTLAEHYGISLQPERPRRPRWVNYPSELFTLEDEATYYRYFAQICERVMKLPGVRIDYATPELPLYFEFFMPTSLAFKTYIYGLTSWNFAKWRGKPFCLSLIDPAIFDLARQIQPLLYQPGGRELWSVNILDTTLRQLEHAVQIGLLTDSALAETMYEEIDGAVDHMEAMTRTGKRFAPGTTPAEGQPDLRVFHNEMTNTSNVLIIDSDVMSFVLSNFVTPNYVYAQDRQISEQMSGWFENLASLATPLHGADDRYTLRFFTQLRYTVNASRERALGILKPKTVFPSQD